MVFPETLGPGFKSYISEKQKTLANRKPYLDENKILKALIPILEGAVQKRRRGRVAIAFSGGVDSGLLALLAKKLGIHFKLFSLGLHGAKDLEWAKKLALLNKWPLAINLISVGQAEVIIKKVARLLKSEDPTNVGVGCVTYAILDQVKKEGYRTVFTGAGPEEIFAGYKRHVDAKEVNEECWSGLQTLYEKDLQRDITIAEYFGLELLCPYLDDDLIEFAMQIDGSLKVVGKERKVVLRSAAEVLGLQKEVAWRKKVAAQYGSGFDRVLKVLAREHGFKYKKDYLKSLR
ncbi:asparagine synthase C-terminal domain-containing protein [Candidatus Woesearchaeota archaeon]|nr:asparagine synthase C-terminal domain-containing protein [Candidatus Woesearchaeota archaeon]